ncbi:cilia- and flagella-associated protein 70-like [Frieseomelitta varia]|uniref:cilia- and flagella-associated protein 70-like n=1 Tax=Frieseomelitta varia TaxID=561572 RepID=UPI001CB69123|nr:cilia- and flagella-associated protein 70-like [Frieseomelitta varia]
MEDWMEWQNSVKNIKIIVHSIENIVRKDDIYMSITAEHNGVVLGDSDSILIKANYEEDIVHVIDITVNLPINVKDKQILNSVVSVPVLIKAFQIIENEQEGQTLSDEAKKKSIFSTKSAVLPTSKLLGICNLDLIPVILGESTFTEKLILETPIFSFDGELIPWQNLPRLTVTVMQDQTSIFQPNEIMNFLHITIESIYNIPEIFAENFYYKAGTIAYIDNEEPEKIIFDRGIWVKYRDVERTKRWNSLRHIENRAQLSKYKLDCDFMGVRNEFSKQFDLAKKVCEDVPRIEWNSLNRCIIWERGIEAMKNYIRKHKFWPFQFEVTTTGSPPTKSKNISSSATQLYQCYVDVSELLFPGRRSCRVVGQLYKFNSMENIQTQNIFSSETQRKEMTEKDKKNKSSNKTQSIRSEAETTQQISEPITTENGEPTIVVIEIELYKPLIACRIETDFTNLINEMIPKVKSKHSYVYSGDVAETQYMHCIQKLAEILTESYRDFCEETKRTDTKEGKPREKYCFGPESGELTCFTQYLYKTGVYLIVRNTLRMKIPLLLDQKFKMPKNFVDSRNSHNFIASIYTYLVEQMHLAINQMVECRFTQDTEKNLDLTLIYFYAEEAYELEDMETAREYYTKAIASNKTDPHPWTRYAIFLKKIGDIERAKECCLEAISLKHQYAIALLVYGMILFENKEYKEAEIFLRAVTYLQPRFFEAWAILHLFFIRIEYYPGVDLALRIAKKCIQDKSRIITLDQEPLSWTMCHCPQNNVHIMVATFLLKLHFCEFAGLALAEEMSNSNRSIHVLYYMAVEHYLSGRYENALSHLEEIRCDYGMNYSVSSLMGHCYFKIKETEKAVECYEFARMLFDRPDNLHLVEIRLGYHYYDIGNYDRARRIFLSACKSSPTCLTWLGVGISCYETNQFHEAEISLSEANRINNHNSDVWGYLCLLNMTLGRYDEFAQCYAEMLKYQNNLKDRKLWLRITNLMKALDYAPPNLT